METTTNTPFKLGPIQELWMKTLEEHPERQYKSALGIVDETGEKYCCLGQGMVCFGLGHLKDNRSHDGFYGFKELKNSQNLGGFPTSEEADIMGLHTIDGKEYINGDDTGRSMASMNDSGRYTWPQIAAVVRANPHHFFKESK